MTSTHARKSAPAVILVFTVVVLCFFTRADASVPVQGFGADTPGGAGKPVVRVTNLNDSGPGSFREALRGGGHRTIVFDVAGEILLAEYLYVAGPYVTIDGLSAPSPGITLRNRGLVVRGSRGAHDVIVRGIRVRGASADGISISGGAYNVLIDRVSVHRSGDGNIDITEGAHDVTVAWSILSSTPKNMLVKYGISRITLHHNLFVDSATRNPQIRIDEHGTQASDTTVDMRNNVIASWDHYGTLIWSGVRANVANNYYSHGDDAIDVWDARAYVEGNVSGDRGLLNRRSTEGRPFAAPFVDTQDACTAAAHVLQAAGARPLDPADRDSVKTISLTGCAATPITPSLAVAPEALVFSGVAGTAIQARQNVSVGATPAAALQWTATAATNGSSWLVLTPALGTAPSSLSVGVDTRGLPPGLHEAVVTFQRAGDPTHRVTVPVSLTLASPNVPNPHVPPLVPSPSPSPSPPAGAAQLQLQVQGMADDAVEYVPYGKTRVGVDLLKLGRGTIAGFRFDGVAIPPRAVIRSAVLHLYVETRGARPLAVRYLGEATADARPFSTASFDLSNRRRTATFVESTPRAWESGTFATSPDLRAVVQEIIASPGWASGNALTLFVEDHGSPATRAVGAFGAEGASNRGAVLVISYDRP